MSVAKLIPEILNSVFFVFPRSPNSTLKVLTGVICRIALIFSDLFDPTLGADVLPVYK